MAMIQLFNAAARRMTLVIEQRVAFSSIASPSPILCCRGDKKTKKGKRFKGSYGNCRPKKDKVIQRFKDKIEVPRSTPWPLPFKVI